MKYHLCLKEENLDVEVLLSMPFKKEYPYAIRCTKCDGIIFRELDKETLKEMCKRFNLNIIKGKELIKS